MRTSRRSPAFDRIWGLSRVIWLVLAGFCAFLEWAGDFATGGRIVTVGDVVFIIVFAVLGVVSLLNAVRSPPRAV